MYSIFVAVNYAVQGHTSSHLQLLCFKSILIMWGSRWIFPTHPVPQSAHVPGQSPTHYLVGHSKDWILKRILLVNQRRASLVPRFNCFWILDGCGVPPWAAVAAGVRALHVERLHPGRSLRGVPLRIAREKMFQSILYFQLKWSSNYDGSRYHCCDLVFLLGADIDDWVDPDRGPVEDVGDWVKGGVGVAPVNLRVTRFCTVPGSPWRSFLSIWVLIFVHIPHFSISG